MKKVIYTPKILRRLTPAVKKEWQTLWDESEERTFFNSPSFFEACLEAFAIPQFVLVLMYKKKKLASVLPLIRERVFGVPLLTGPGRKGNYIDKLIFLSHEKNQELFERTVEYALSLGNLCLSEMGEDEKDFLSSKEGFSFVENASSSRKLTLSPETNLLQFMSSHQKRELRRHIRQHEEDIEFTFQGKEALETVFEVERKSHRPRRRMDIFGSERSKHFFRTLVKHHPKGIHIGILSYKGTPVATNMGFAFGKTFCGYHTAFLEEHKNWGAGKVAFYFTLEELKKRGYVNMDFLRGDSELKRRFAKEIKNQYTVYLSKNPIVLFWWGFWFTLRDMAFLSYRFVRLIRKKIKASRELGIHFFKTFQEKTKSGWPELLGGMKREVLPGLSEKKKLPILIFSNYDDRKNPWYGGGGAISIHEVAKRLTRSFKVRVITGQYPGARKSEMIDGVRYERVGVGFFGPKVGQLLFHCVLPYFVMTRKFDIWIESFTPPFSTSFLPLFTGKPVIGLGHMLASGDMERKYKLPFRLIESFGLGFYRSLILTSDYWKTVITGRAKKADVAVIGNGVSEDDFSLYQGKKEYISFLGRLEMDQKGLDLLLEAYAKLAPSVKVPLVIAGGGTVREESALKNYIHKLGLQDKVILKGRLSTKEKKELLASSLLNIVPSRFETFSSVSLETLASGVPLVTFDIDGLKWLPDTCAIKVKKIEADALAQAMRRGIEEEGVREELRQAGMEFARSFRWENIAKQYVEVISEKLSQYGY